MHNVLWVHDDKSLDDASHDNGGIPFIVGPIHLDPFEKFASIQMFQDDMHIVVRLIDFMQLDDVFMVELPQ